MNRDNLKSLLVDFIERSSENPLGTPIYTTATPDELAESLIDCLLDARVIAGDDRRYAAVIIWEGVDYGSDGDAHDTFEVGRVIGPFATHKEAHDAIPPDASIKSDVCELEAP